MTNRIERDMDELEYHRHPALSATGMKHLLRSPLHYRQAIDHRKEKAAFDVGHAFHAKVLGVGLDVVEIPESVLAKNGAISTTAAKDFIADARAAGQVPLKADTIAQIDVLAEAVLRNVKARRLLEIPGETEISLFATDPETGVEFRGRLDRLAGLIPIDLKSTNDVRRGNLRRTIENFGYEVQAEAYRELIRLTTGDEPRPMQLIFAEVDAPHEVRVVQLAHEDWIEGGRVKMRAALRTFARCMETGEWPGEDDHTDEAEAIEPRPYYRTDIEEIEDAS